MSDPHRARRTLPHGVAAAALALALVSVYAWLASRGSPSDPLLLVASGAAERSKVWHGEVWRLLTGSFLHADGHHLAINCLGLVLAGRAAERALGARRFLLVYAAGAVGGAAVALLGRDAVGVGAAAGVFGVLSGLLVAHYRTLGGLRPFLRSRLSWIALALVADSAVPMLLPERVAWGDFMPTDHLAHVGGFLCGGAVAVAATAVPGRAHLTLSAVALLAALATAACWPRSEPTAFEGDELQTRVHQALRAGEVAEARRLLDEGARRGLRSDGLTLYRALTQAREGDLEGALALLRPLAGRAPGPLRDEARRQIAGIAYTLGYRHYSGDGRPKEVRLGLSYFQESCEAGDAEACGIVRQILEGRAP